MPGFTVRLAKMRDLTAISRFATPVVRELKFYNKEHMANNLYEMSVKDLRNTLTNWEDSLIVAVDDHGGMVGLVAHNEDHGHTDWLDWILVGRGLRGRGIGRAMLDYAIRNARRHGRHGMWSNCHPENRPAIRFFRRAGFRRVGVMRRHAFRQDEILWEKPIG